MNRLLIAFITFCMVSSASSCNLRRKVTGRKAAPATGSVLAAPDTSLVSTDPATVVPGPAIDTQRMMLIRRYLPLWNAQTGYTTFSGKASVNYEGKGESQAFNASIRMEKDKRIWLSITAVLGIEVARALITPDTIIAIDRFHKEVHVLPFAEADKLLPVHIGFATLQSLIIGDVLHAGGSLTQVMDKDGILSLIANAPDYFQIISYMKADTALKAQLLETRGASLQAIYDNYSFINSRRFANSRELNLTDKDGKHRITLEFTKVSFDEPVDMGFSVPSKYERK